MSYTLTIWIADPGTEHKTTKIDENGQPKIERSIAGHMWYELRYKNDTTYSYGFSPIEKSVFNVGEVSKTDNTDYFNPSFSFTIPITETQFKAMEKFGDNATEYKETPGSKLSEDPITGLPTIIDSITAAEFMINLQTRA